MEHSMAIVDWVIVFILLVSVLGGLAQGFFRSAFSLAGLVLGLSIAAWNYKRIAVLLEPIVRVKPVCNAIGFALIALVVMAVLGILGSVLAKMFKRLGLGCLDRLAGGVFGFFQGALLVTIGILVMVAFFPPVHWLAEARLPRFFFAACHLSTHVSPDDLAQRVRDGLRVLEDETPRWLHPNQS
jgi:membrane protein required for colicin V production